MKIKIDVDLDKNEGTDAPWWILIDPSSIRSMIEGAIESGEVPSDDRIITMLSHSVEGPYFSREAAETYLKARHYEYSSATIVYCKSGYWSRQYKDACREARKEAVDVSR